MACPNCGNFDIETVEWPEDDGTYTYNYICIYCGFSSHDCQEFDTGGDD